MASTTQVAEVDSRGDDTQEGEGNQHTSTDGDWVDKVMVMGEPAGSGEDVEVRHVDINWCEQWMGMCMIFLYVEVLQVDPQGFVRQVLFHVDRSSHRPLDGKVGGGYKLDGVV